MEKIWNRIKADIKEYHKGIIALCVYYISARLVFRAFCPMVILTGLPCPGCGLSRAVWFLITAQPIRAFRLHPLGAFWLLLILYFLINRYIRGRKITRGFVAFLMILALATLILYCYRMLTVFPDRPPLSYTGRNMLERIIPGYRQKVISLFRLCG